MDSDIKKFNYDATLDDADRDRDWTLVQDRLYNFLCTEYGVVPNAQHIDYINYYSYMTMFHPMPCVEAMLSMTWAWLQSLPGVTASALPNLWTPWETFEQCSETWIATIEAYALTYLASALYEENHVFDSPFTATDMLYVLMFYAQFGMFWIHSAYPNYVMADYTSEDVPWGVCEG